MTREELLSTAKPILFNTDMVRAILSGQKTVTRRIMKPQPWCEIAPDCRCPGCIGHIEYDVCNKYDLEFPRTRYRIGDVLYVRETWQKDKIEDNHKNGYIYKADYEPDSLISDGSIDYDLCSDFPACIKWKPSIHMPKRAARIFLKITSVRMERLQDIDYEGCKAEGIWDDYKAMSEKHHESLARVAYVKVFSELWNDTIKSADLPLYGWDANPWVWVIEFERLEVAN